MIIYNIRLIKTKFKTTNMKKTFLPIFILLFLNIGHTIAQVLTTTPELPTETDAVTVIFDATQGNAGLQDFTGDIYAHTGVITDKSTSNSDWKYVIAEWNENIDKAKLTPLGDNKWELKLEPSIRDFYEVPAGEKIQQLAFVFRSADGSAQGKETGNGDIFYTVYQAGLSLGIISPENGRFVNLNEVINISVTANNSNDLTLYLDSEQVSTTAEGTLDYTHTVAAYGQHWIVAAASNTEETIKDSVYYYAIGETPVADLPSGDLTEGVNYIDDNTATLVLYAPGKDNIFVIGDFTDWEIKEDFMMNKTPDGNRFWLTIENLEKGKEYIYQYLIDGSIKIADPYTEKISEPWNDKYITDDTYPGLIDYPEGKTDGIASVLQTAQTPYTWESTDFTAPAKEDLVIYELHIRDWTDASNLNTVLDSIEYFTTLGINAIELMPINEFEGNDSWGYNPSFYFAPDKYYGTKADYKKFIDECHKRGIAVIIDMVLNHSFGQSPFVQMYFKDSAPSADNPWYNVSCPHSTWCWGYDFDHESEATRELIDRINSYWLSEYKVDGFRFDFTKGFTNHTDPDAWGYDQSRIDNLTRMADAIWNVNDDAYVILEHLTDNSEEKVLVDYGMMMWGNMNHNYSEAAMGYSDGWDLSWATYKARGWSKPNLITYMESHDEERMMFRLLNHGNSNGNYNTKDLNTALKRVELAAAFFFTIPGPKMIWQFGELGYDYSIDFNGRVGRKPIEWDYYNNPYRNRLYHVFSALINLKTGNEAFKNENFTANLTGAIKSIKIEDASMDVLVLGNFDLTDGEATGGFTKTGTWYEYFTGEELEVSDVNQTIALKAGEYRIYTSEKIAQPNIPEIKEPVLTVTPEGFEAGDEITVTIDMNNIDDFSGEDLYMWFNEPEYSSNGTWGASSEDLKMTNNGDGTYSFTITGSLAGFFNVDAATMRSFSFTIKTKDGAWSSIEYNRNPYFELTGPVITFTPETVNSNVEVTMRADLSHADYPGGDVYLWLWEPDPPVSNGDWGNSSEELKMTNEGGGIYTFTFGPTIAQYYGVDENSLTAFNYLLKSKDGSWKTADNNQTVGAPTAIDNTELNDAISVYPNPAKHKISIKNCPANARIEIRDILGKKIIGDAGIKGNSGDINISRLHQGVYFIVIYQNNKIHTVKKIQKLR